MVSVPRTIRARLNDNRIIAFFAAIYLASQIAIGAILRDLGGLEFLKAQTTFSRSTYLALFRQWESAGLLAAYRRHFYLDFFHPIWYAVLLAALLAKGLDRNTAPARYDRLLLMPFLAGLLDLVENCFHLKFISDPDAIQQWMITSSALAANIKWTLAGLSMAVALFLLARSLVRQGGRGSGDEAPQFRRG